ncbi:MAG: hypothetical protein CMG78_09595 [Marinobacter sp.]|nr:hypothetical protein [Marinobacter sp.]|tara:strand:- start:3597 stop:4079 length:483 start_codon:yes stop_codon:yes gene_type:complete
MDFDLLDLREAADKEYWVQLRMGDTLLFADMDKQERPCRVKVASIAEPGVEDATKAVGRVGNLYRTVEVQLANASNRDQRRAAEKRLVEVEREAEKCLTTFLVKTIRGWENLVKGGELLPFSAEALLDMAQPKAPLFRMASAIAEDAMSAQNPFSRSEAD